MTKPSQELISALIAFMSITTLALASNEYAQPLLDIIAHDFAISPNQVGFIVTAVQPRPVGLVAQLSSPAGLNLRLSVLTDLGVLRCPQVW